MILIDLHRRNLRRRKRARQSKKTAAEAGIENGVGGGVGNGVNVAANDDAFERKNSFTDQDDILPPVSLLSHQRSFIYDDIIDLKKPELTIYSEEGIADMDLPDNLLMMEDLEYLDNITSCNKVENCLMLSEYEQNLIKENESPNLEGPRKWSSRKWSMFKTPTMPTINSESEDVSGSTSGIETNKSVSENSEFSRDIFSGFSRKSLKSKFVKSSTSQQQQQQQQQQHQCQHQQQQQQPTANVVSNNNSS